MASRAAKKVGKRAAKRPAAKTRAQKGSLRVQSWIYAVINPLIDVLSSEVSSLEKGHLSWRAHVRRLEFIRPPRLYLLSNGQAILEDFERTFPEMARPLRSHERFIAELTRRAVAAHDSLVMQPTFRDRVLRLMMDYRQGATSDPFAGWSEADAVEEAAEYLVNHGQGLERTNPFWRHAVPILQEYRHGEAFSLLKAAVVECHADGMSLIDHLKDVRFQLCDEYDIPAAPVEGIISADPL
jgi:hypothetical protein